SGAPMIHTASTLPSFIASTAAGPAKGKNVAVSEFTPPLPRTCSAEDPVALPSGPMTMRFPFSCDSRSHCSFEQYKILYGLLYTVPNDSNPGACFPSETPLTIKEI